MKILLLTCLAVGTFTLMGCCDHDDRHSTYESASMESDSKDMHPMHHHRHVEQQ